MASLLLFGGLGTGDGPPLPQLRKLAGRPENGRFFAVACDAVRQATEHVGEDVLRRHLPAGLPLREWLAGSVSPSPAAMTHSVVAGVCTHLYQMCLLQPHLPYLRAAYEAAGEPACAVGHSLGLHSAVIAALRIRNRHRFLQVAAESVAILTAALLHCQEVGRRHRPEPAGGNGSAGATPMACVLGLDVETLRAEVAAYNRRCPPGTVEIGLVNGPRSLVVTGPAGVLADFFRSRAEWIERPGVRWFYLPSTVPFHHSSLSAVLPDIVRERDAIGYGITAGQLRIPVYVSGTPGNLQESPDILRDCSAKSICQPVDWYSVLSTAVPAATSGRIIDFGPGLTAQVFTRECARHAGFRLRYVPVAT